MNVERIEHTAALRRWTGNGNGNWFLLDIDGAAGQALAALALMQKLERGSRRGFGAVKVAVQIGGTCWETSVFPQKSKDAFILPVKAAVRNAENLGESDPVTVVLEPV